MSEEAKFDPTDAINLQRSWARHTAFVRLALLRIEQELQRRSLAHDLSKLKDDEFAGFSRINAVARINKFGSPEYDASMEQERAVIAQHFARNSHHVEYWTQFDTGGKSMGFLDVIEMVCDWYGARQGYDDPRPWSDSVELNLKAKGKYLNEHQLWLARQVAAFFHD